MGHRDRQNEMLIRDPALLSPETRRIAGSIREIEHPIEIVIPSFFP
jgi:hypothetical protein